MIRERNHWTFAKTNLLSSYRFRRSDDHCFFFCRFADKIKRTYTICVDINCQKVAWQAHTHTHAYFACLPSFYCDDDEPISIEAMMACPNYYNRNRHSLWYIYMCMYKYDHYYYCIAFHGNYTNFKLLLTSFFSFI